MTHDTSNLRPRLLVHVGLPKTATTSLQRNVLMPLHKSQRINFLGRCTFPSGARHDRLERFRPVIGLPQLTDGEVEAMRPLVEALLHPSLLNVISDERMAGMETVADSAEFRAVGWLDNLARLFRRTDATVAIALRSPADFVLSAYTESYFWRFHGEGRYNTFGKFIERLLAAREGDPAWIVFFYGAYLRAVRRRFRNVQVLLYEDLLHEPEAWHAKLSSCLEADPSEIERLFSVQTHNVSTRTATGRRSRRLTVRHLVREHFRVSTRTQENNRQLLQRVPLLTRMYHKIAPFRLPVAVHHAYPDDEVRRQVLRHLRVDAREIGLSYGISAEKLARYGYLGVQGDDSAGTCGDSAHVGLQWG